MTPSDRDTLNKEELLNACDVADNLTDMYPFNPHLESVAKIVKFCRALLTQPNAQGQQAERSDGVDGVAKLTDWSAESFRELIRRAIDYHDTKESEADAYGASGCADWHNQQSRMLSLMLPTPPQDQPQASERVMRGDGVDVHLKTALILLGSNSASDEDKRIALSQIRTALEKVTAASPASIPDGYVLVRKEPTDQMLEGGASSITKDGPYWKQICADIYKAMIAAAPKPETN